MTLMLPCDLCNGDGFLFDDDGHIENRKAVCPKCKGKKQIEARTGEVPEASASPDGSTLYAGTLSVEDRTEGAIRSDKIQLNERYSSLVIKREVPAVVGELWEGNKPTKLMQTILHDPDNGQYGDCQRTCIAMMLGLSDPTYVPHFAYGDPPSGVFWDRVHAWLGEMGYKLFTVYFPGELALSEIMRTQGVCNPGIYWMLSGRSVRGTQHVVVCLADAIWHDPHPDGGGIVAPGENGFYTVEVLVPISMTEFRRPRGHEDLPLKPGPV